MSLSVIPASDGRRSGREPEPPDAERDFTPLNRQDPSDLRGGDPAPEDRGVGRSMRSLTSATS